MDIRFNRDTANKIGAFKATDFAKHKVVPGDYLIKCHNGDVVIATKDNIKQFVQWNTPGVYFKKATGALLKDAQRKIELQLKEEKLLGELNKIREQDKKQQDLIQKKITHTKDVSTILVMFIKHTEQHNLTKSAIPLLEGHEIVRLGIRYDHRKTDKVFGAAGEALFIALIKIPGLSSTEIERNYNSALNHYFGRYSYIRKLSTTGYHTDLTLFTQEMTTVLF